MDPVLGCYVFMTALFSAVIMVPPLRRWALESGNVDEPDARKVHKVAVPRIGGIAIFLAYLFSCLVFLEMTAPVRGILAGGLVIFITGLVDDISGLSPKRKFLGEIAACLVTIFVGNLHLHYLGDLFGTGEIFLPVWVGIPFTVFAVVGVINAVNLMDGLDGLAGGVSVIALVSFAFLAYLDGNGAAVALCLALLGALLGFLKYNFFPARVFMGDTGSLGLGFALGFMAIFITQTPGSRISPVVPVLILGLPILDTVWVMSRRIVRRISPFAPDKTHLHHKFLDIGFQHRFTVIFIYGISLFWAIFSVAFHEGREVVLLATYLGVVGAFYLAVRHVVRHPDQFTFLRLDSPMGIRQSVRYKRLAEFLDPAATGLFALLLVYLVMAVYVGVVHGNGHWQVLGILLAAGGALLVWTRDVGNSYLLALLFVACLVLTYGVETYHLVEPGLGGLFHRVSDGIFAICGVLAGVKVFLRKDGEFFVGTADVLILGLCVFLAIAFSQLNVPRDLLLTLVKGAVFYLAIKVVSGHDRFQLNFMVYSILSVLAVVTMRGMV